MNTLFQHLALALNTADALSFRIQATDNGQLRLTLLPELKGEAPTEGEGADLRAALAMPLVITDTPLQLDADFIGTLREYAQQRASLKQSLAVIDSLKQANTKAAAKATKASSAKTKPASATAKAAANPTADAPSAETPAPATDADILL